jgi:hypothetical protein
MHPAVAAHCDRAVAAAVVVVWVARRSKAPTVRRCRTSPARHRKRRRRPILACTVACNAVTGGRVDCGAVVVRCAVTGGLGGLDCWVCIVGWIVAQLVLQKFPRAAIDAVSALDAVGIRSSWVGTIIIFINTKVTLSRCVEVCTAVHSADLLMCSIQ